MSDVLQEIARADRRRARIRWMLLGCLVIGAAAQTVRYAWEHREIAGVGDLGARISNEGRVVVLGSSELLRLSASGTTLLPASTEPAIAQALSGTDEVALVSAMTASGVAGILVAASEGEPPAEGSPLGDRMRAYGSLERLQCQYLDPVAAFYVPRTGLVIEPPLDQALAHVARSLLGGARPPRVQSFPEPLRRIRNVEVMVMLRERGRARLWRSARGSSIARALMTAAVVARQRWNEREAAMGGPLDRMLPSLEVEVILLDEDGTLGSRIPAFVDRVFGPAHGVAFDHRGTWRYLMPDATAEEGEGSAVRAYRSLFTDSDMDPETSLDREDVRLYRMLARSLARSSPTSLAGAGLRVPDSMPELPDALVPDAIGGTLFDLPSPGTIDAIDE